jgi:ADP-heptose:LPS heptosyltransferase
VSSAPFLLALRALGLGDFLTGVPAYRALARRFPRHCRILAAPAVLEPLVSLVGGIDALAPTAPLSPLYGGFWGADVAVNLHGKGPQSHRALWALAPKQMLSFASGDVSASSDGPVWMAREAEIRRWCRMLAHYGIAADPDDLDLVPPPVMVPRNLRDATIVHVGAAAAARRWPIERWAGVIAQLRAEGERVIVTGSQDEAPLAYAAAGAASLPSENVLAGGTNLVQLAALIAAARRLLASDTGVAHLATAYRVPSVVLFGPTPPEEWGPPARRIHRALWKGTRGDPHAARPDPGLLQISVDEVVRASEEVVLQGR